MSEIERLSGGGRDDDLFGRSNDFSNSRINKNQENKTVNDKLYFTKIDWSMKLAYQLTYNNSRVKMILVIIPLWFQEMLT